MKKWQTTDSKYLVQDRWLTLRADTCVTPAGDTITPWYVIEYLDGANCLVIDAEDHVILLEHYRHGIDDFVTEIVGGLIDATDTSPRSALERELKEEIGYTGGSLFETGVSYANPSMQTARHTSFLAVGGLCNEKPQTGAAEMFQVRRIPFRQFMREIEQPSDAIYQALHLTNIWFAINFIKHSSDPQLRRLKQQLP